MKLLTLLFALLVSGMAKPFRLSVLSSTRSGSRIKPRVGHLANSTWVMIASAVTRLGSQAACALMALRSSVAAVVSAVETRFAPAWGDPRHAAMAARLFVASTTLALAGIVSAVTVVVPPATHLRRLAGAGAGVAERGLQPAAAGASEPAADGASAVADPGGTEAAGAAAPAAAGELAPAPPAKSGGLPVGKGMWIWMEDRADGGDAGAIVARAKAAGLTHLYVRTGTLKGGFIGGPFLDRLLPVAHARGIRVYGWDFPYLNHPGEDVKRAMAAIRYTTPDGHRIDGFSADIETPNEGTNNNIEYVTAYSKWLRDNAGPDYPLIATVPNPTSARLAQGFPYAAIIPSFSGVAPMVYWMNRDPGSDVANAIAYLSQFGKPIFPVGQAYDGGPEGGPPGPPGRDATIRFLQFADASGATGASFWSYQHATAEAWDAIRDAAEFRLELGGPQGLTPGMIRSYQTVLSGLGFPVAADGVWGPATAEVVRAYQAEARLPQSGVIDEATRRFLLAPVPAPLARH